MYKDIAKKDKAYKEEAGITGASGEFTYSEMKEVFIYKQ